MHGPHSRFLALALRVQALKFGEFTLKSGRVSPYFFNAGRFDSGMSLAELAACYADTVETTGITFDLLFGPAYKGIPLVTALACEFARRGRDVPLAFNRKEVKAHGEGGALIGARLTGQRVLLVDDVITAGTAIGEALELLMAAGAQVAGILVALDREERVSAEEPRSAVRRLVETLDVPVFAMARLTDLLAFANNMPGLQDEHARLVAYRARYGANIDSPPHV